MSNERKNLSGIKFNGTIPFVENAIRVAGDGGARIMLDIPESQIDVIDYIMKLRDENLVITLEIHESEVTDDTRVDLTRPIYYG